MSLRKRLAYNILGGVHTSSARPDLLVFQLSTGRPHRLGSAQKLVKTIPFCINRLLEFVALSIFWPAEGSKQVMHATGYLVSPDALKLCASMPPSPQPCHYPARTCGQCSSTYPPQVSPTCCPSMQQESKHPISALGLESTDEGAFTGS
eukprot:1160427-Pelagomonas_calceolata.AAC.3